MRLLLTLAFLQMIPVSAAPFIVAHRGASGDAPENTLPAFELAWEQGADAVEGDFHLTQDGHIVCFHDHDTKKLTGKKLVLKNSSLQDLRALDVGAWKNKKFAGTRIPTFAEVAASVPKGKKIYIEIKCGPEIVGPLLAELKISKLHDEQIVVISFDAEVIREVKKRRPKWVANLLYSFDTKKPAAPALDLPGLLVTLQSIMADGLSTNAHPGLTSEQIAKLGAAGYQHHVWTVNDTKTARRFLELGTKSLTTDLPGAMRTALK